MIAKSQTAPHSKRPPRGKVVDALYKRNLYQKYKQALVRIAGGEKPAKEIAAAAIKRAQGLRALTYTPDRDLKIVKFLARGESAADACRKFKVSYSLIARSEAQVVLWLLRHPDHRDYGLLKIIANEGKGDR